MSDLPSEFASKSAPYSIGGDPSKSQFSNSQYQSGGGTLTSPPPKVGGKQNKQSKRGGRQNKQSKRGGRQSKQSKQGGRRSRKYKHSRRRKY